MKKEVDNMNCTLEKRLNWQSIQWKQVETEVQNLQHRIFVAKQKNDRRKLRRLQKLLLKSRSNILLALRRVTVYNKGKKTPGIDKVIITKSERMNMFEDLLHTDLKLYTPLPVKRIYIPKPDVKQRHLGIATIKDRCIQAMTKNCLEPEWEAVFESTSYGFRPGRSAHDAISRIYNTVSVKVKGINKNKWILDADIEGFYNVCHKDIIEKLDNFPGKQLVIKWLAAGYLDRNVFHPTQQGTGGIISPLLANIALCDLERILGTAPSKSGRVRGSRVYVRYADDFVVLCGSLKEARTTQIEIATWLKSKNLKLAANKTRIVHIDEGFDFLGVNIRHYDTSKTKSNKVLMIQPSKKSIEKIKQKLREEWQFARGKSIVTVLNRINPIIKGWCNYFCKFVSTKYFRHLDNWTYVKCQNYASRMHPQKGKKWIYDKYFKTFVANKKDRWIFGDKSSGQYLKKFTWTNIRQHILVKGYTSPYDPTVKLYWENRYTMLYKESNSKADIKIAEKQKFLCSVCELSQTKA
jgi:RNA-directed DNA polymerase